MMNPGSNQPRTSEHAVTQIAGLWEVLIANAILYNEQVARALGMGIIDLQTFGVISRHDGPITPTEVSARTGLPASTTTRVLDRLEEAGYVARRSVPGDRRKVAVDVLPEKAAEIAAHYTAKINEIRYLNSKRTRDEVAVVISYLRELADVDEV